MESSLLDVYNEEEKKEDRMFKRQTTKFIEIEKADSKDDDKDINSSK